MRGTPKATFDDILTVPVADFDSLRVYIWRRILDTSAARDRLAYLRRTPKSSNMPIESWLNRIEAINVLISSMEDNTNTLNDENY